MFENIYKECSLYQNLVYPRYVSDIQNFSFIPGVVYEDCCIVIHREDELWYQKDKLAQMIVADNDLKIFDADDNIVYIADVETYISNSGEEKVFYLNELLDDTACWIHRACGTWIGNTNTQERITEMKSTNVKTSWHVKEGSDPEEYTNIVDAQEYTVALKRIWGFEPDKAESSSDISKGIIDGFSKKYYSVLVKKDNDKDVYIPTVDGTPLTDTQIANIISTNGSGGSRNDYPTNDGNLLVSD